MFYIYSGNNSVIGKVEHVFLEFVKMLMEPCLISSKFGEFDTNSLIVSLENSDANLSLLLLITLVLCFQGELGLVLLIVDNWLHVLLLAEVLVESLFDHVWIIG